MLALPAVTLSTAALVDTVQCADALDYLRGLPSNFVNCIVTSPPYYGLRDYGIAGQIGLEETPAAYVERLRVLFAEARRVLRDDGVLWLNLGDSYANDEKWGGSTGGKHVNGLHGDTNVGRGKKATGLPAKNLIGIPWRVAFALQDDGWILRSDVIWHKPNPMPESVTDRPTKAHEYVFLFSKQPRYWYDADAIKQPVKPHSIKRQARSVSDHRKNLNGAPGQPPHSMFRPRKNTKQDSVGKRQYAGFNERYENTLTPMANARTVWSIPTKGNSLAHFAMMPPKLARRCILAGCPRGGIVLDPFMGAGTTAKAALSEQRHYVGSELNPEYVDIINNELGKPIAVSLFDVMEVA